MNILNIITDTNIGGAGLVLINYMREANRERFSHTVIVPQGSLLAPRLRELCVNVAEMPGIGERSFSAAQVSAFLERMRAIKPDLTHTHASLSARIAARAYGKCKIVYTRHCAFDQPRYKTRFPMRQLQGLVNNALSDHIIAISPAAMENLVDTGVNPKKITTMFNGVPPVRALSDAEKAETRAKLGIPRDAFVCAIIARLEEPKGHEYVLSAASALKGLPLRFVIAGAGSLDGQLRGRAKELGLDNCVFTGFVRNIATIENIMDLQLNASFGTETSSLSLLEGMCLGVPAVASDFGGNPGLIEDGVNGLIVPRKNADALAAAIRRVYEDKQGYADMSVKAKEIYAKRFTAKRMAEDIERVYTQTLCHCEESATKQSTPTQTINR